MPEPQRQPKDVTRGVIAAEDVARKAINRSVVTIANYAATTGLSVSATSALIGSTSALAITKAREAAATRAVLSFERQTGIDVEAVTDAALEEERASAAGSGLAKAFHEAVREGLSEGLAPALAFTSAAKAIRPSVERTATTEVMHAWNGEARRLARTVKADILQTWHAELDACDGCASLDGKTANGDGTFPEGDPPLHSRCRCYISSERVTTNVLDSAEERINELGAANADYPGTPGRDLTYHRGAYEGASAAEVNAIATGAKAAKNSGKILPPITLVVEDDAIIMRDGGHRTLAARQAGATHIRATVITYDARGEKVTREAVVSIRGKRQ